MSNEVKKISPDPTKPSGSPGAAARGGDCSTREHPIRLRGGWESSAHSRDVPPPRWTLPLTAFPDVPAPVRLLRSFQAPRLEPGRETLWLRLADVPGLVSVFLNDFEIARAPFTGGVLLLPIGEGLPPRNRLVLDVGAPPTVSPGVPWGDVSLVIVRDEAATDPA